MNKWTFSETPSVYRPNEPDYTLTETINGGNKLYFGRIAGQYKGINRAEAIILMRELVGEVLLWAKTTGDYSMNPYCENFVRLAVKIEETLNNA